MVDKKKDLISRRNVLRKGVFASATLTSIGAITNSASATDWRPPEGGGFQIVNTTSEGDYKSHTMEKAEGVEAELSIGSSVTASPYTNPPGPVFVNWLAHVNDGGGAKATKKISNLEVEVTISDSSSINDQWRFLDPYASLQNAPEEDGYADSFGVSAGYMGLGIGISFSAGGDQTSVDRQEKKISYNFGDRVVSAEGYENDSNTGWIQFNVNNPVYSNIDYPVCALQVTVTGDFTYDSGCPGPYCQSEKNTLLCTEKIAIDFSN